MIDWNELEELYLAARSDNEKVRGAAQQAIDAHSAEWVAEYLQLPENAWTYGNGYGRTKGDPEWENFEALADNVSYSLDQNPDEPNPEFRERSARLKEDRLGTILRHRKIRQAKADPSACDCDFTVVFGDTYHLGVRWCISKPPHEPKEIKV
jgi:hypothetical protein